LRAAELQPNLQKLPLRSQVLVNVIVSVNAGFAGRFREGVTRLRRFSWTGCAGFRDGLIVIRLRR